MGESGDPPILGIVRQVHVVPGAKRGTAEAVVLLDDGVEVAARLIDCDAYAVTSGDRVRQVTEADPDSEQPAAFTTLAADQARTYAARALAVSTRVPGLEQVTAEPISAIGILGAGTMGTGIAKAMLAGGLPVTLVDTDADSLARARDDIAAHLDRMRARHGDASPTIQALTTAVDLTALATSDLVVEAVYEDLALKQQVMSALDAVTPPNCLLATNTSTFDIDVLAAATSRPERVVGLHFFSPAHVMRLVEVVRGARTSPQTLATSLDIVRRIGKTPVVVGVCHGFVGNRMMIARNRQADALLLEGATPEQVDRVLQQFGLPMGPYEMLDLGGGIEVNYRRRQSTGEENWLIDQLFLRGRVGQKAGRGFFRYEPGGRTPIPDEEVHEILAEASARSSIARRPIADDEIRDRLVLTMVNEGARILAEGIARCPEDIDVIWRFGFGWPDWKGGPMYCAQVEGPAVVVERLRELERVHGVAFAPSPLLVAAATSGRLIDEAEPSDRVQP